MYRSLDKSIRSSPDSKKLPPEGEFDTSNAPPSLKERHDRVNNIQSNGTTKRKRIRGKLGLSVMNNLVNDTKSSKRTKLDSLPTGKTTTPFQSLSPRKEVASSPIRDVASILDQFERSSNDHIDGEDNVAESESDIDDSLIEVGKFSSSPLKRRDSTWDKIDKMIEPHVKIKKSVLDTINPPSSNDRDLASIVANGDFLSTIEKRNKLSKEEIALKYGTEQHPDPIISKQSLLQKCLEHLSIVPLILKGKLDTCYLYPLAKLTAKSSVHETMTQAEKFEINWSKFFGGYYGFQRQSFIASIILNNFDRELQQANRTNKVVAYWTINGFATFILANEIILRMIMKDFDCTLERAEVIMRETSEYGIEVADEVEMIDDLGKDDPLNKESATFMRGLSRGDQGDRDAAVTSKQETLDVLDIITKPESGTDSESESEGGSGRYTRCESKSVEDMKTGAGTAIIENENTLDKLRQLDILDRIIDSDSDSDSS